jgi:alkylhydroperoxidase family enzyme
VSRLNFPPLAEIPAGSQRILDTVGAQLGFVPYMFKALASNPAVLEVVATLQGTLSRVLDAKTRHTIALAVSQSNGCVAKRRRETMRHAWQDTT